MNAYELADEFKEENNNWNEDNLRHWGRQTEAMLRQQQAEIDKVNAELVQAAMALGACVQENHSLKAENEELSALCVEFNVLRKAQKKC